ncbi:MAG TPA: ABC transporter ATP-binding protein [Stellaceae bacterium]|nr:ABC transporter ATP-binding protein [Stellaceae bacterium]
MTAAPARGGEALRIDSVGKTFSTPGGDLVAIRSVSLEVEPGEFLAIVGPSGCGKSTLLQIVAGLISPSSGKILLGGQDVTAQPAHMVYLFQQYSKSLLPWQTVEGNVLFSFNHRMRLKRRAARDRCREYLEMVGLKEFAAHYPWQLSGGMQQRVAIARGLAAEPRVLLLDEPFSSVDALTRLELHALILDLWTQKRFTAVLVTHDVDEAIFLADRVAVLSRRPGAISEVIETHLPRPRQVVETHENPNFLKMRHRLLGHLLAKPETSEAGHA